jgi:hypothetical protein
MRIRDGNNSDPDTDLQQCSPTLNTFVKDDVCAHKRLQQEPGDSSDQVSDMPERHWQIVHKTTGNIFSLYD